jgi:hypothetical protein
MISFRRRHAAVATSVTVGLVAAGTVLATSGFAEGATARRDLGVQTSALQFQPPATLPDAGAATVTVTNVGATRPPSARVEVDTVSRLNQVTANGLPCRVVAVPGGTDVARCAIPPRMIPAPGRSLTLAVTVDINSPPGNCSCVPFTVRLLVAGDGNPVNNTATATIIR